MNLRPIKANMTELQLSNRDCILFSYKIPVAMTNGTTGKAYKTSKWWSNTTSKHITQYFNLLQMPNNYKVEEKPQEWFDNLVNKI